MCHVFSIWVAGSYAVSIKVSFIKIQKLELLKTFWKNLFETAYNLQRSLSQETLPDMDSFFIGEVTISFF